MTKFIVYILVGISILGICWLSAYLVQLRITKQCAAPGQFIAVNGVNMHYIEKNSGDIPVVFLHGASSNARDWKHSLFNATPDKYHLVALDRPGLGHSEPYGNGDFHDKVELIHKSIQLLGLEQPILVVHSLAGVIGARLLAEHPDRYKGLIIIAGATYPIGDGSSWYTKLAASSFLGSIFRHAIVPVLGPLISAGFVEKSFQPNPVPHGYQKMACLELLFSPSRFLANAQDLNHIRPYLDQSYPLYSTIEAPVSLIYGAEDQVIYQFSHAAGFRYKVPHANYIMLPQTGHLPHFNHPEIVIQELDRISNSGYQPSSR